MENKPEERATGGCQECIICHEWTHLNSADICDRCFGDPRKIGGLLDKYAIWYAEIEGIKAAQKGNWPRTVFWALRWLAAREERFIYTKEDISEGNELIEVANTELTGYLTGFNGKYAS